MSLKPIPLGLDFVQASLRVPLEVYFETDFLTSGKLQASEVQAIQQDIQAFKKALKETLLGFPCGDPDFKRPGRNMGLTFQEYIRARGFDMFSISLDTVEVLEPEGFTENVVLESRTQSCGFLSSRNEMKQRIDLRLVLSFVIIGPKGQLANLNQEEFIRLVRMFLKIGLFLCTKVKRLGVLSLTDIQYMPSIGQSSGYRAVPLELM